MKKKKPEKHFFGGGHGFFGGADSFFKREAKESVRQTYNRGRYNTGDAEQDEQNAEGDG